MRRPVRFIYQLKVEIYQMNCVHWRLINDAQKCNPDQEQIVPFSSAQFLIFIPPKPGDDGLRIKSVHRCSSSTQFPYRNVCRIKWTDSNGSTSLLDAPFVQRTDCFHNPASSRYLSRSGLWSCPCQLSKGIVITVRLIIPSLWPMTVLKIGRRIRPGLRAWRP